uniref:Uncharacterized protein n=1 Tax=Thermosporothrix sp. COM3 TaxID=2490863 RepID=A0A455SHG0_9CHLR|nr:hypothetical protein KTC_26640 [Thermosporothrix sp. COM3]
MLFSHYSPHTTGATAFSEQEPARLRIACPTASSEITDMLQLAMPMYKLFHSLQLLLQCIVHSHISVRVKPF